MEGKGRIRPHLFSASFLERKDNPGLRGGRGARRALDERRGFGAASLEFHNRPRVFPRCLLAAQVIPKKSLFSRLQREPLSAPEREGKVGSNSCPELQPRDSQRPSRIRLCFGRLNLVWE